MTRGSTSSPTPSTGAAVTTAACPRGVPTTCTATSTSGRRRRMARSGADSSRMRRSTVPGACTGPPRTRRATTTTRPGSVAAPIRRRRSLGDLAQLVLEVQPGRAVVPAAVRHRQGQLRAVRQERAGDVNFAGPFRAFEEDLAAAGPAEPPQPALGAVVRHQLARGHGDALAREARPGDERGRVGAPAQGAM